MKSKDLTRRLLGGLAGLALGVGGALALAAPAQAGDLPAPDYKDTCAGTYIFLPEAGGGEWSVTTGGEAYWPGAGDEQPGAEGALVFAPADAGEIKVFYDPSEGDPVEVADHTWQQPGYCERLPGPEHTQPTCDAPGTITIPDFPEEPAEPTSETDKELTTELEEAPVTGIPDELPRWPGSDIPEELPTWWLNGEPVEKGSTHEVEPGTHVVELVFEELTIKSWVIEMEEPDCPDDPGEGGELPKTGTSTAVIAGGAGLLLAIGAGLFVMARRRRITFTA